MLLSDQFISSFMKNSPITYHVILPSQPKKVCLFLHGYQENVSNLIANSNSAGCNLENLAQEHNIAFLLPQMPDMFLGDYYFNRPWQDYYAENFLVQEFLPEMIARYELPSGRENTFIAGTSMGGFGSLLLGSHFPDVFSKIISISGAFIIKDVTNNNPEVTFNDFEHFQKLFGNIPSLRDCSYRNPEIAALNSLEQDNFPDLFVACGKDDLLLYSRNISLRNKLEDAGATITWYTQKGKHDWGFYSKAIKIALHWISS